MDTDNLDALFAKRVIDMTGEDLFSLVMAATKAAQREPGSLPIPRLVYGITGLAKFLGCSDATAWRYKKSGRFDAAISQFGDKIIFDTEKVLQILKKNGSGTESK